jgi:hypothetical protein
VSGTVSRSENALAEAARGWLRRPPAQWALLLAVVAVAVLPLAVRGPSCGQDFDFHLESWLDAARSWHQGVVDPRWDASANFGAGEPRFVFYPPLSWMLGAALGSLLPWRWVPLAFTALALLGAGWSFRAMAREWMPEEAATLAACLYLVNPYLLFVAYERSAMGELLAAVWLPLLVLYGLARPLSLREQPHASRAGHPETGLAVAVAGIWLTNAPAGVMGCYLLALLVAVAALQSRNWRLVTRAAGGVALGLGLAAFWLVPAVYQQRWVEIGRAIGPLMRVEDSFLFGYVRLAGVSTQARFDAIYHNDVLRTASWIAVGLLAGTALAAWTARRRGSRIWLPLVVAAAAIGALQLRWSGFVWRIVPELRYLQFPWRWMLVLGMIFAALAGLAMRGGRRAFTIWAAAVVAFAGAMALPASSVFCQACDEQDNVQAQITQFHASGFEGTDEYTLKGADASDLAPDDSGVGGGSAEVVTVETDHAVAPAVPAQVRIERWQTEQMDVLVNTASPGFAVLRLTDYPAWRVTRNGAAVRPRQQRDGLMAVPVDRGENRIEVRWRTTADQQAGIGISLLALAVTLALGWGTTRGIRKRKAQKVPVP